MPAYNAARTLERTYADIPHDIVGGIILVDDVSHDETVDIARQLGLDVIIHPQNLGYGGNQKTCYDAALAAGADIVVMLHPDYQYDATRIPALVAPIAAGERDLMLGQPVPRRPAGRWDAALEVREQPLPHRGREPGVRAPPVRISHRAARLQPAGCWRRSRTASTATTSCSTRSSSRRSWRPGWHRGSARSRCRPATSTRLHRSASGGASCTGCRPCGWWPATSSIGCGCAGPGRWRPDAGAIDAMARLSRRALLRGGLGIAISLFAIWVLLQAVDVRAAFEVLRSASLAWILVMVATVLRRHRVPRGSLAGPARPDRPPPISARPWLHLRRLPRQQRPAGTTRRAVSEPRPRGRRGHQPAHGPRHGRGRARRGHDHGRGDRGRGGHRPERAR